MYNVILFIKVLFVLPSSDELRRMQEQMQRLQQQLEASQNGSSSSLTSPGAADSLAGPKSTTPKSTKAKTIVVTQKTKMQAGKHFQLFTKSKTSFFS